MLENAPNGGKPVTPSHVVMPRLVWMALGPVALLTSGVMILTHSGGWLSPSSLAFLIIIPVMIVGRFIEQKSGFGLDSVCEPTTWTDFRNYVLIMVPVLIGAWIVLNVIGGIMK